MVCVPRKGDRRGHLLLQSQPILPASVTLQPHLPVTTLSSRLCSLYKLLTSLALSCFLGNVTGQAWQTWWTCTRHLLSHHHPLTHCHPSPQSRKI